ncbi:hypothetical protein MYA83_12725 [Pseudomonas palleroniana]|uniref:hypothetical protein n=1 Tax=Pseudomonas palleroniana TaxID=191390 RepID=UPI003B00ADFE
MQKIDQFSPTIAWRSMLGNKPNREPVEVDVRDGRAEYLLSGPYRMTEGSKIEVVNGSILWTGGRSRPT